MDRIPTSKFVPRLGKLYSFGKEEHGLLSIGLEIPLVPFDPELRHLTELEETFFDLNVSLPVPDAVSLAGKNFESPADYESSSICLGSAHNPVRVERLTFGRRIGARFEVELALFCMFSSEGIAEDERITLQAKLVCEELLFG